MELLKANELMFDDKKENQTEDRRPKILENTAQNKCTKTKYICTAFKKHYFVTCLFSFCLIFFMTFLYKFKNIIFSSLVSIFN